ncbi:hypothetical protein K2173_023848 [Erythroxylum novogranatense]|uniref:BHLH domain-containing protein n=1 Tax=Erythroxylum novogranatense TaxID=1862640 RepID=A0AAV8TPY5_9ROSI|nr:hypothetical protein K2173_023848 [Erythroxylum novogranatense]
MFFVRYLFGPSFVLLISGKYIGCLVKASNIWLCPPDYTWQSINFNRMSSSLEPQQKGYLPTYTKPGTCMPSEDVAMFGFPVPSFPSLFPQQNNQVHAMHGHLPPHFQNLAPAKNFSVKEKLSYCPGVEALPSSIPACYRGYVIFDQSGNGTRVMYSPFCSIIHKPTIAGAKLESGYDQEAEECAAKMDQMNPEKLKDKESNENHSKDEESEMHEDTEEINALLYSSSDGCDSYSDDDDEVTSTGHSPVVIGPCHGMQQQEEEMKEEVASSAVPNKRQKLLDGGYKKSSLGDTSSLKSKVPRTFSDLSYIISRIEEEEVVSNMGNKESRRDKNRATLKILKTIVPGAEHKDPLLVLDEAIAYLKSLKLKVKNLGANQS